MGLRKTTQSLGYGQYAGAAAVVKLKDTPAQGISIPTDTDKKPTYAVIVVEGGTARWMCDGLALAPTAAIGVPLTGELDSDASLNEGFRIFLPVGVTMNVAYFA